MEVTTEKLLEIIGELEVSRRFQKLIIDQLELTLAEPAQPTPIKAEEQAANDTG